VIPPPAFFGARARLDASPSPAKPAGRLAGEQALQQSARLAALGQLVSSVAHELNNPLSAILLFTEDLLSAHPDPDQVEGLTLIAQQARRSRAIVRDLLTLVWSGDDRREQVNPAGLLRDVIRGLRRQTEQLGVSVSAEVDGLPVLLELDQIGVEQVVTNLVINAAQAASPGGHVCVRARLDGDFVIEVTDDGPGISPEAMPHIFEPFYTTKPAGEGTGLGLAVSMGLVERSGGTITASNRLPAEGGGAIFVVRLPGKILREPNLLAFPR
jgi:two-component system, NtrC family, sensor kinase